MVYTGWSLDQSVFLIYVAMDSKPYSGAGIQNAECGLSGIMMQPRIDTSKMNEAEQEYDEDNLPHGTKVPKELVIPWANTDKIIISDSYFVSVPDAE